MARTACLPFVLLALAACSKPATNAAAPKAMASATPTGNACDRGLVTAADAAAILDAPVTEKALPGDAQSCVFTTADFSTMTVSLRPGVGHLTIDAWKSGRMNAPVTSVAGVGDQAVWQSTLHEIIAEKSNLLCDIEAGPAKTPAILGSLCNRVFAAS